MIDGSSFFALEESSVLSFSTITGLRISLASPEQIHSWSSGEVTVAETINYRTLKPERDGLFCERIFGPTKSWHCACGKYKRPQFKGKVCDVCGVQVAPARVRRERMGHIELAVPVSHVWYARSMPSRIALLLDFTPGKLNQILAYTRYIVLAVDEHARLQEIRRLEEELACLESADAEEQMVPSCGGAGDDEAVPIRDGKKVETPSEGELRAIEAEWGQTLEHFSRQERIQQLQQLLGDLALLAPHALLEIDRYQTLRQECGQLFRASIGATAIQELLEALNLEELAVSLRTKLAEQDETLPRRVAPLEEARVAVRDHFPQDGSPQGGRPYENQQRSQKSDGHVDEAVRNRVIKRLKVVEALRRSGAQPQWMILTVIPVLPPALRPVLQLQNGRFASSDINELYCRVIHRNNRLKRFMAAGAPELMLNHEKAMLQAACDALFDNAHLTRPMQGANGQPLRSLTDSLSGKEGRFRHNLLGKRVDYSGRSVISVGLELKMYQCGLPKKIALELFKPFIIHKLVAYKFATTPRHAKRMVERRDPAVWDILDEVMRGRCVLLNRAPTLHRMSIQVFEPVLVEGGAIRLHPQVCAAFNADFDGDQMAVHLPLSDEAQQEARAVMLSTRNLLSPASGEPIISVSQEQVLGCYYLTQERPNKKGEGRVFSDTNEALLAYDHGVIDLQARIAVRLPDTAICEQPAPASPITHRSGARLSTTAGRLLFNEVLPEGLRFKNYAMKKDYLKQVVWDCIKLYGFERAAMMADAIKRLGFRHATRAGISFAISDVTVPTQKKAILAHADGLVNEVRAEWERGLITRDEQYQQTIAIWTRATDEIAHLVQDALDPYGSLATIASSGATKAKLQQIRQLSGMRGLMASPSGAVIETPVRGNFLEGLAVAEYFLSSHGARKSLMDRSLNTAHSGYLTIRLVNLAQEVIVTEEDCGTTESLLITDEECKRMGLSDSRTRLFARVLARPLPQLNLRAGDELDEAAAERILAAKITEVSVRSVLYCRARRGVCRRCYGWDLSKRALVQVGVAVGIIAAQSIGEPGTQLTMRTFHSGGIAGGQGDITQGLPRAEEVFEARVPKDPAILSELAGVVSINKDGESGAQIVRVAASQSVLDEYALPEGSTVLVGDRSPVEVGRVLALLPASQGYAMSKRAIRARMTGQLTFNGVDGLTITAEETEVREYIVPPGRKVLVSVGQWVQVGQPLTAGALNPFELLRYQGREALACYILQEAQQVYRTTGAYIHDKHFEIIIRQMLRYVRVQQSGDTELIPEELRDRFTFADINAHIVAQGGEPASALPILLGLTRATLATESWLSAASFQQTGRVLTDAALAGQIDHLVGLKENVIVGHRIPAGTGLLPPKIPPRKTPKRGRRK